jgi:mono/diheme cytochrome c family protein
MGRTIKSLFAPMAVILVASAVFLTWLASRSRDSYEPRLEFDPDPPEPPAAVVGDFQTFLGRLSHAAARSESLLLHGPARKRAEEVFRNTAGVPQDVIVDNHSPYFLVDPESIFALFSDLPTLERGLALFQQQCSVCHGPFGRGNGPATREWYAGNYPRNFWYGQYKNRSTKYATLPTDSDIFRSITRGLYGSAMPAFRHLTEEDRWALVQLLKALANFYDEYQETVVNLFDPQSGREQGQRLPLPPEPKPTAQSVKRGRIVFIEQGCVACHQGDKPMPVGLGRWEGNFNWYDEMQRPIQHSRDLTAGVFRAGSSTRDIFRIISGGPNVGPMPNYLNLSIEDRWALAHYVRSVFRSDYPQAPASADAEARPPQP